MELFDKLLNVSLELEILFHKMEENKENKEAYSVAVEYYLDQEQSLLRSISKSDLDKLIHYMKSQFGFSFTGTFFPKFFLFKENHLCLLRVYRQAFQLNQFYQLQSMSDVSRYEAESLGISSYMLGVKERDKMLSTFEQTLLNNYLLFDSNYKSCFEYLCFPNSVCCDEFLNFSTSLNLTEELLEFVGEDIYELSLNAFEHNTPSSFFHVFQTYFFTLEEECHRDIFQFIKGAYLECHERNETVSIDWVMNLIKDYSVGSIDFSTLDPLKMKPRKKIKHYTYADINKYEAILFSVIEITKNMWHFCKNIIDSKLNKEPQEKRKVFYEEIKKLLATREEYLNHIPNFEEFRYYISYVYGVEEDLNPFLFAQLADSITHSYSLEDIDREYSLIEEFAARSILNSSASIELDSDRTMDGISTALEDNEDLSNKVNRLENVLKEFIHYFRGNYTEENFFEKMNQLNFDLGNIETQMTDEESLSEELSFLIYNNFQYCFSNYFKSHDNTSPHYRELLYAFYLSQLFDGDLEFLIQKDFQKDFFFMSFEDLEEDVLMDLEREYCSSIEMMCESYSLNHEFYDVVFQIYLEALSSVFPEESLEEFQRIYFEEAHVLKRS